MTKTLEECKVVAEEEGKHLILLRVYCIGTDRKSANMILKHRTQTEVEVEDAEEDEVGEGTVAITLDQAGGEVAAEDQDQVVTGVIQEVLVKIPVMMDGKV